ncbi:MAG: bifunctional metallophosphatase/5'-nucleotidase [Chloroflexota bacterium]|nr:bifunctional metallophosphatase/5'-nucleotidase [Chloroflexota bacterium]
MSKKTIALLFFLLLVLLVACVAPTPTPASTPPTSPATSVSPTPVATALAVGPITVTILHTNDMHGYLEGDKLTGGDGTTFEFGGVVNAVGTLVRLKQDVGANVLTLDGGDFWQGTFPSNRDEGKAIIAAMNAVGYDAITLGNHDFDHGQDVLKARATEAKFPFLAANILDAVTGMPPAWVKPYFVKQVAGLRFGIIGLANSGTPVISKASNSKGLKFIREQDALKQILSEVKSQSDFIVVLAHEGIDQDQILAANVPGVDVIVSAHTHVEQRQPKFVNGTIIVHAGYKAQYVGRLDLKIDPATRKIVDYTKTNEPVPAVSTKATPPKAVVDQISTILADARDAMNRPIGATLVDLNRVYTADGRSTGEYASGNLVVDAMLAANQAGDRPADLAIHNNAGIRADIPKGPLTYGRLYEMLPFDNILTAMDLKGEDIKAVLDVAVSCPRVNTLVAGISFVYDCSKPPGSRVYNIMIQGKPMDPQKVYRVQTIDYLATGGDGQVGFTHGTNIAYGDPVIDVVTDYVAKHSPINPQVGGRMVEAGK